MIKGHIINCSYSTDSGRRSFGIPNAFCGTDQGRIDFTIITSTPLSPTEMEELTHLLNKRVRIEQDERSPRPLKKKDINKLTFRG